ncbi:MAG TPA: hypothetical protein VGK67_15200 [Myxococcales bacterium]|jgi:hypothetical protein
MDERIGTLLLQARRIREFHLEEALRRQRERGGRVGTNLVEMGAVDLDVLAAALAAQRRVPLALDSEIQSASREALALLSPSLASQLLSIPLSVGAAGVVVAVASPWDPAVAQALAAAIKRPLLLKIAPETRIFDALEKLYRLPHPRKVMRARLTPAFGQPAVAGPIPGLEPIVAAAPLTGPLASALAPTFDVADISLDDAAADSPVEELSGDLFLDETPETAAPPAPPAAPAAPLPPALPVAPMARVKTPLPLGPVGLADPLSSMSWDLPMGGATTLPSPPALTLPAPLPVAEAPAPLPAPPPASPLASPAAPSPAAESEEVSDFEVELDETPQAPAPAVAAAAPAAPAAQSEPQPPTSTSPPPAPAPEAPPPSEPDLLSPPPEPVAPAAAIPATPAAPASAQPSELEVLSPPPATAEPSAALPAPAEEAWSAPPAADLRPATSLYMVEDAIARASRPEKVVESLLWGCEGRFEAAVFFVLDGKRARARDGFGPDGPVPFHDGFSIDLAVPSLFRIAIERQRFVLEVPTSQAEAALCAWMRLSPQGLAAAIPFFMHGSVVSALWASCGSLGARPSLASDLERLAELGASAFARLT